MGLFDCGPSSAEKRLAAKQEGLADTYSSAFRDYFGKQSAVLQNLSNIFTPIAQAGPDQQGFGSNQLAALHTQATEGVGTNYAKATRALQNNLAVRGGGSEALPTGGAAALKGELASAAANEQSNADLAITNANYATGRQNFREATAGLQALGSQYNPGQFGSLASGETNQAFESADKINQEQLAANADIIGGVVGLGMDAATFGMGAAGGKGITGGLKALGFGG